MPATSPIPTSRTVPQRRLGTLDGVALIVSNVIGVGIFTTPGLIAGMVPNPLVFVGVWLAGGALAFIGALSYAELAALHPRAGGEYLYLREAFGPLAGFLAGWTSFVAGFSGAIAASAVGFAIYLGRFLPLAADATPLITIPLGATELGISMQTLVALVVVWSLSLLHLLGAALSRRTQNVLALGSVASLVLMLVAGFILGRVPEMSLLEPLSMPEPGSWLLALVLVMFTYSGWNAAVYVAEEVVEPRRNLVRALALGTAAVVALYLLINLLYLWALPLPEFAGTIDVGDAAAESLLGTPGAVLITLVILAALASSVSAMIVAGPRIYFAMARAGHFPVRFGCIHARRGTPAAAILLQAGWCTLLVLSGTFEALVTYTGFAVVLFATLSILALFRLRVRHGRRPYFKWGASFLPMLFVGAGVLMVVNALIREPVPSVAGLGIILSGIPVFLWMSRRSGTTNSDVPRGRRVPASDI